VANKLVVVTASVSNNVPPEDAVYQRNVPATAEDAERFTAPDPHLTPAVTEGAAGVAKIVAVTAVLEVIQVPLSNSTWYVVVEAMAGVLKADEEVAGLVDNNVPPTAASYQ
jgi:hypothetical protein